MSEQPAPQDQPTDESQRLESLKKVTAVVYLLQAIGIPTGGVTPIIAVVINYIKRKEVEGTWLESHFRWQINTFWFVVLLELIGIGTLAFGIGAFILIGAAIFLIFRIVRGWMQLSIEQPMLDAEDVEA